MPPGQGYRLVVFDMDGTLTVPRSCWAEIHAAFGSNNDEGLGLYLKGEITDQEFVELDLRLWREALGGGPIPGARVRQVLEAIALDPGTVETLRSILAGGLDIVILTGGLDLLALRIVDLVLKEMDLPSDQVVVALDHALEPGVVTGLEPIGSPRIEIHANRLVIDKEDVISGRGLVGVIAKDKGTLFSKILKRRGLEPEEVVTVGDGPVDIVILEAAGLGVAVADSHPRVVEAADVQLDGDLTRILPLLGL